MPYPGSGVDVIGVDRDKDGRPYGVLLQGGGIVFHFIKKWDRKNQRPGIFEKGRWRYSQQSNYGDLYVEYDVYSRIHRTATGILLGGRRTQNRQTDDRQRTLF